MTDAHKKIGDELKRLRDESLRSTIEQARALGMLNDMRASVACTHDERTCAAAKQEDASGRKYRLRKAPALPLPQCDAQWCRCTYIFEEV